MEMSSIKSPEHRTTATARKGHADVRYLMFMFIYERMILHFGEQLAPVRQTSVRETLKTSKSMLRAEVWLVCVSQWSSWIQLVLNHAGEASVEKT